MASDYDFRKEILSYGGLDEIRWLFMIYTENEITNIFISVPYKDYFPARFHYVKNMMLHLQDKKLDSRLYVKNTPRYLG